MDILKCIYCNHPVRPMKQTDWNTTLHKEIGHYTNQYYWTCTKCNRISCTLDPHNTHKHIDELNDWIN